MNIEHYYDEKEILYYSVDIILKSFFLLLIIRMRASSVLGGVLLSRV